ncbi:NUDIX hydrolase [Rhizobium leguminosarum]|uniref:NUDIX hydrolase n=1 Tax=Rhizobium leguminosarum TaxID=384 RepID=UPI001954F685|nr:NUDIX hydrolase [Rhizobium leguminosarum]
MSNDQAGRQSHSSPSSEENSRVGIHTQYAAICFREAADRDDRQIEILLITSRDSGRWVIPKGWPMRKKQAHEVASIEAWQEAGVRGSVRKKTWGSYLSMKKMEDGEIIPTVVEVHLLHVEEMDDEFPERKQRVLRWFSPANAVSAVREPDLGELISKLDLHQSQTVRKNSKVRAASPGIVPR